MVVVVCAATYACVRDVNRQKVELVPRVDSMKIDGDQTIVRYHGVFSFLSASLRSDFLAKTQRALLAEFSIRTIPTLVYP